MSQLKLPVLSVSCAADRLIAPQAACRKYLEAFGGDGNRSIECGLSSGFSLDYPLPSSGWQNWPIFGISNSP